MVPFFEERLMREARKLYHFVAAGPKTAEGGGQMGNWEGIGGIGEGRGMEGDLPPPYAAMRPVLTRLCFSSPTFSTPCWAITSPVAKSTYTCNLLALYAIIPKHPPVLSFQIFACGAGTV